MIAKIKSIRGQVMLLTVILISGAVLASTSLIGLIILYQLRQATGVKGSMQAIFAADSGIEWAFYNETRPLTQQEVYPKVITLTNGTKVTVTYNSSDPLPIKAIGQYGRSARAFQATSPASGTPSKFDLMFTLDRSGSIDNNEIVLVENAVKDFVTALQPSLDGTHIGLTSFGTYGTFDLHLTYDTAALNAKIDNLSNSGDRGATNLSEGLTYAIQELDDAHVHDRPEAKDVIIVVTDGCPNKLLDDSGPGNTCFQPAMNEVASIVAAARNAGIEIFAIAVGLTEENSKPFPKNRILKFLSEDVADDTSHFYEISDFDGLKDALRTVAKALMTSREVVP